MQVETAVKYESGKSLAETPSETITEMELQALWFEQLFKQPLFTEDGIPVEVVQPGLWNHGAGPDFHQGAIRFLNTNRLEVGSIEVHLEPVDWDRHGHHEDSAYENTVLHVVWDSSKTFFPATQNFRQIPQVCLQNHLIAPWPILKPLLEIHDTSKKPASKAGPCQKVFAALPLTKTLEVLQGAGHFRLRKKAERWRWRIKTAGFSQALWEALAEGMGYHENKIPFRLLAQRLPVSLLKTLSKEDRIAYLFGIAGFLPNQDLKKLGPAARNWVKPHWERWWKARASFDYAVLPKAQWKFSGVRPWNRPERRVAALNQLFQKLKSLENSIHDVRPKIFQKILADISDLFWNKQASLGGKTLSRSLKLVGSERIQDLMINIFWPMVSIENPEPAKEGISSITSSANRSTEIARQRVLGNISLGKSWQEGLIQQGLLQIYQDYCLTDASQCEECTFPDLLEKW
jgi:hypothetical protein